MQVECTDQVTSYLLDNPECPVNQVACLWTVGGTRKPEHLKEIRHREHQTKCHIKYLDRCTWDSNPNLGLLALRFNESMSGMKESVLTFTHRNTAILINK